MFPSNRLRRLMAEGKLSGPPADLMAIHGFNNFLIPRQIRMRLIILPLPKAHTGALLAMLIALDVWIVETQDRGEFPEPDEVVAPFDKEMHDWFGTPDWYKK